MILTIVYFGIIWVAGYIDISLFYYLVVIPAYLNLILAAIKRAHDFDFDNKTIFKVLVSYLFFSFLLTLSINVPSLYALSGFEADFARYVEDNANMLIGLGLLVTIFEIIILFLLIFKAGNPYENEYGYPPIGLNFNSDIPSYSREVAEEANKASALHYKSKKTYSNFDQVDVQGRQR